MDANEKAVQQATLKRFREVHAQSTVMRNATDWVSQLGESSSGRIGAYLLYGQLDITWQKALQNKTNYATLREHLKDVPEIQSLPIDNENTSAMKIMVEYLSAYGCWTVSPRDWYIQRYNMHNQECTSILPDKDAQAKQKKDVWINAVDGQRFQPKDELADRLLCLSLDPKGHTFFYYCLIGKCGATTENEIHMLRLLALSAEYSLKYGDREVSWEQVVECLTSLRIKASTTFAKAAGSVYLRSISIDLVEKSSEQHEIICQHEELSLSRPNLAMHCMVLPKRQQLVLCEAELQDILGILLSFSGIDIHEAVHWSANEVKKRYSVDEWGKGMHEAFRRVTSRATILGDEVSSWVFKHFESLDDKETPHYPDTVPPDPSPHPHWTESSNISYLESVKPLEFTEEMMAKAIYGITEAHGWKMEKIPWKYRSANKSVTGVAPQFKGLSVAVKWHVCCQHLHQRPRSARQFQVDYVRLYCSKGLANGVGPSEREDCQCSSAYD